MGALISKATYHRIDDLRFKTALTLEKPFGSENSTDDSAPSNDTDW